MFESILIANRGEIACRIERTAQAMGIRTIAVYSDPDENAQHVRFADEAHRIGPGDSHQSYLHIDRILDVASKVGVDAIHPGYGFLSENSQFADAVTKAGIRFIGPSSDTIRTMGLKHEAKSLMEDAGIPVIPGWFVDSDDLLTVQKTTSQIGYPVLIKAVAGGGGRGIRLALDETQLKSAIEEARQEAGSSFNDNRILIEKYIPSPRHIEVQIIGDNYGHYAHLWERDCSIQRRYQKMIEEAPAPGMTKKTREALIEAAIKAAEKVDYSGVGTVEFILDSSNGLKDAPFYFMEMNTRLQVEHPVTEMITGIDIVGLQIRIASGEPLPTSLKTPTREGHAIEARLYAEDPNNNFRPSAGKLRQFSIPANGKDVRVDAGVVEGDQVSIYYDSMLAKIIARGTTRASAIRRLTQELSKIWVEGPSTNASFLSKVVSHPSFIKGHITTDFLCDYFEDLSTTKLSDTPDEVFALACLHILAPRREVLLPVPTEFDDNFSPWNDQSFWRGISRDSTTIRFSARDQDVAISVAYCNGAYRLELPGGTRDVVRPQRQRDRIEIIMDDTPIAGHVIDHATGITVTIEARDYHLSLHPPWSKTSGSSNENNRVVSPMPGIVTQVLVGQGARIQKGQPLIRVEAMKMIHTIASPRDALVETIHFAEGSNVEENSTLISLKNYDS